MEIDAERPLEDDTDAGEEHAAPKGGIRSIERALDILEALAAAREGELDVKAIGEQLRLPESTVYRLLSVLMRRKYVRRLRGGKRYVLGAQLSHLREPADDAWLRELRREARPILEQLAAASGESANLVVPVGYASPIEAIYIDQVLGAKSVRMLAQIGQYAPLYCTGAGKVLLAYLPKEDRDYYLAQPLLEKHTDTTITDAKLLRQELKAIRRNGYAIDRGELERDVYCVAAPVFDHVDGVRAAISISGPSFRFPESLMEAAASELKQQSRRLSERLGSPQH